MKHFNFLILNIIDFLFRKLFFSGNYKKLFFRLKKKFWGGGVGEGGGVNIKVFWVAQVIGSFKWMLNIFRRKSWCCLDKHKKIWSGSVDRFFQMRNECKPFIHSEKKFSRGKYKNFFNKSFFYGLGLMGVPHESISQYSRRETGQ